MEREQERIKTYLRVLDQERDDIEWALEEAREDLEQPQWFVEDLLWQLQKNRARYWEECRRLNALEQT